MSFCNGEEVGRISYEVIMIPNKKSMIITKIHDSMNLTFQKGLLLRRWAITILCTIFL